MAAGRKTVGVFKDSEWASCYARCCRHYEIDTKFFGHPMFHEVEAFAHERARDRQALAPLVR